MGAANDDHLGANTGAAYLFQNLGEAWTETAKLTASDGAAESWFGNALSLNGDLALVGAFADDEAETNAGATYVFEVSSGCPADVNGDGTLDVLDFVVFQLFWQDQHPIADCDVNAEFNVLDFVCFQQLFVKGCE